ncbi:MAG: phosphoribulokinase/uridine kinase, partial [Frankiales bacterium]|nr:phosphoribulokinase/uridine kinase [Frankiales bacterium]
MTVDELLQRAAALAASPGRTVLGIVGPPGAGKSTLAEAVVRELRPRAAFVPMDGFHLADTELARLHLSDRKGAPETFDAAGYVALLKRIAAPGREVVYAPRFVRALEMAEAGALPVAPDVPLVVTEGNYLLGDGPFAPVRDLLTECWYVEVDRQVRLGRLIGRHVANGRSPE